jgi:predicted N-acyltransferase
MPLYLKDHSWGEFVFDHAWAQAYSRSGRRYYPKLVACVPFTPVPGPRLLFAPEADRRRAGAALLEGARQLAEHESASSVHILFPEPEPALVDEGLLVRKDCQFHWHNAGYGSFDDFLGRFTSARRKKVRRERRRVREAGIRFRHYAGPELEDALLDRVYDLHANTFLARGQYPYLTREFFHQVRRTMGESLWVIVALRKGEAIACAIFFRDANTLYGRYWGADGHYHSLHFETCFYQAIDHCIEAGIGRFEPGAQGEHKLRRGFDPVATWSHHWVADPAFAAALARHVDYEREWVDDYIDAARDQLPYRQDSGPAPSA